MVCPMIRGTREGHFQGYTCVNIKKKNIEPGKLGGDIGEREKLGKLWIARDVQALASLF